jgi:predicted amidohydrolase YtcJ
MLRSSSPEDPMNAMARIAHLVALGLAVAAGTAQAATTVADRIWSGGPILTMNDAAMRAEAIAEKGGRIIAVGSLAEVMKTRGRKTEVIDLGGRTLLPGFVDSHGHVVGGGLQAMSANLLAPPDGGVRDIASLQQVLREWIAANDVLIREAGVVIGFGYDNAQLAEQRHPTRDELAAVSRELPIMVVHQSGHFSALNSKALEIAGFNAQSKDPAGGVIRRRAGSSEPDGVLEENAHNAAAAKLLGGLGAEAMKALARAGVDLWARYGYTTAQEGRTSTPVSQLLRALAAEGGLKIDVAAYPDVLVDREFIRKNASPTYVNRLRVAGAKLTIDGSPQGFTAWRDRPYHRPAGDYPPGYAGYPSATHGQVIEVVDWAFANGVQIITHANGEAASDLLIAAIGAATAKHGPADRRPVLIHGQLLREDQVAAYQRLDVFPSLFPMHTFYWGDWHRDRTVGPVLAENISPTGWVTARGMRFGTHHDAPVAFPDSMRVLDATVTRRSRSGDIIGPAQRVDVITALKAMTIWPAYQHFEEATKGSLQVGKLADFAILSKDPTTVDPETLDQIRVTETIKEGATIFRLDAPAQRVAELTYRPDARGRNAIERMLVAGARYQDFERLPPFAQRAALRDALRPGGGESASTGAPADAACATRYLDDIVAAAGQSPGVVAAP